MTKPFALTFSGFAAFALLLGACSSTSSPVASNSAGSGGTASAQGGATVSAGATAGAPSSGTGVSSGGGGAASVAGAGAGGASGALSSSSGGAGSSGSAGVAGSGGVVAGGTFTLTSPDFTNGSAIPKDATCATTNTTPAMPALAWTGVPAGTKSFALTFLDNTRLPNPQGDHYAMYDIPADVMSLPQGLPAGSPPAGLANLAGAKQKNPFAAAYLGPCPNNSNGTSDTYAFTLYALSQDKLPGTLTDVASIVTAIKSANPLGQAVLTGTSDAKGTLR